MALWEASSGFKLLAAKPWKHSPPLPDPCHSNGPRWEVDKLSPQNSAFKSIVLSVLLKLIRIYETDLKANFGDNLRILLSIEWPPQEWRKNVPTEVIVVVAFGADAEMQIISLMSRLIYCNFLTRKEWMTIISTTSARVASVAEILIQSFRRQCHKVSVRGDIPLWSSH